jgi:hypothetical protein
MRRIPVLVLAVVLGALAVGLAATASGQSGGSTANKVLFGALKGSSETPKGDSDGYGAASGVIDGTKFCWAITVRNIDTPNGAHIHKGRAGTAGPVVIPLKQPSGGDPGAKSGCRTIASDLANDIRKNPSNYYWNVHNKKYPGGAVRGQVFTK